MMPAVPDTPIQREGPFLVPAGPARRNAELLFMLTPAVILAVVGRGLGAPPPTDQSLAAVLGLLAALCGSFSGLLTAPSPGRAVRGLDWAVAGILYWLFWGFFDFRGQIQLGFFGGLAGGLVTARPRCRALLAAPALIPLAAVGLTAVFLWLWNIAATAGGSPEPWPALFRGGWGPAAGPVAFSLLAAGFGHAGKARGWRVLAPWLTAGLTAAIFFGPSFSAEAAELSRRIDGLSGLIAALALAAPYLWPLVGEAWRNAAGRCPPSPPPPPSPARPRLRCGHRGQAPRLAEWAGLANCRLAAAHDHGFLLCPYGCLGLGDCVRACPHGALRLGDDGFPAVDETLCQGCGRCGEACPKSLFELTEGAARAFIPCGSASPLKKNAAYCPRSCLGCGRCRKACPAGAIGREGTFGALRVDQALCRAYGPSCGQACAAACRRGVLTARL